MKRDKNQFLHQNAAVELHIASCLWYKFLIFLQKLGPNANSIFFANNKKWSTYRYAL